MFRHIPLDYLLNDFLLVLPFLQKYFDNFDPEKFGMLKLKTYSILKIVLSRIPFHISHLTERDTSQFHAFVELLAIECLLDLKRLANRSSNPPFNVLLYLEKQKLLRSKLPSVPSSIPLSQVVFKNQPKFNHFIQFSVVKVSKIFFSCSFSDI